MIEFISFVLFVSLFALLVAMFVKSKINNFKLVQINLQLAIEKAELFKKLEQSLNKESDVPITQTEGFVNFISQSRDWAFDYIETVQVGIDNFVRDAGPSIEYFDKYGDVIWTPLTEGMEKISAAYKDLKVLIPEDYGKLD
jgi:hypothetical protein